jgi:hypothetical protein
MNKVLAPQWHFYCCTASRFFEKMERGVLTFDSIHFSIARYLWRS